MIVLGIDVGERRIGVAVSDPLGVVAQPLWAIERESLARDVARVGEIAAGRGVERIVVGLPIGLGGSSGPAVRAARRFANALRSRLGVEVDLWDERLTTVEAERALIAAGERRARRRELVDAVAAALILQSHLDSRARSEQR